LYRPFHRVCASKPIVQDQQAVWGLAHGGHDSTRSRPDVKRPFLIGLLEARGIEYRTVGKHRRIRAQSLMEYIAADDRRRRDAADELTQLNQEMGLL
jgi:hypothetical protein